MYIYKVEWSDGDSYEKCIVWFSTRLQAEKYKKEVRKDQEKGTGFATEPTIQECNIELTKKDVLSFLNFYCGGDVTF